MKIKKTNNRWRFFSIAIFVIVLCFGFGKIEKVQAATDAQTMGECSYKCPGTYQEITVDTNTVNNLASCLTYCNTACNGQKTFQCYFDPEGWLIFKDMAINYSHANDIAASEKAHEEKTSLCPKVSFWSSDFRDIAGCVLLYVLSAIGMFLQFAGTLFGWIIEPRNIESIIDNTIIYSSWALVRDVLNVSFIMFLLFSAFSTVFQVDKYSYKSTLRTLILMALLVNFSYPITRFIIDLSNVLMFYMIDKMHLGDAFISSVANKGYLGNIIHPTTSNPDIPYLIMSIIFLFVFTVTIFVIALLFLIRTVALAILVIFSSLAFIGEAIPPLSSYASEWWKKLFSYAFFGPLMVFMLVLASDMMDQISQVGHGNMQKIANLNSSDPDFIASVSFFIIPIVILWIGLGVAGKMGIAGASLIVGKAEGFMKKTGGVFTGAALGTVGAVSGYNYAKDKYTNYKKAKDDEKNKRKAELVKNSWSTKLGEKVGKKPGEMRDSLQSKKLSIMGKEVGLPGGDGARKRQEEKAQKEILEQRKKWKDEGVSEEQLQKSLDSKNTVESRAAALEMSEKRGFGKKEDALKNYQKAKAVLKGDKINEKTFEDKAREKHSALIIRDEIEETEKAEGMLSQGRVESIYEKHFNKLTNDKFADQKDLDLNNPHIRNYIENRYAGNISNHQDVFRKLSGEKQAEWIENKLMPAEKRSKKNNQPERNNQSE